MIEFGQEQDIVTPNRTYRLDKLRNAHLQAIVAYLRELHGDVYEPLMKFKDKLNSSDLKELVREAKQEASSLATMFWNDPRVQRYINDPLGSFHVVKLLFQRHHPGISEDEVDDVVSAIKEKDRKELLAKAAGKIPNAEAAPQGGGASPPA
jgi:ribosomal protein L12E/L44/L45/RPP1/RPP2